MNTAFEDRVKHIAASYVRKKPGALLTIGILHREQTHIFAFGDNPIQSHIHPRDVIYEIGSITKVFTTSMLATLIHNRTMGLDNPISQYGDGIRNDCPITLKHLATHTSGLPAFSALREIKIAFSKKAKRDPYCQYTWEELIQRINRTSVLKNNKFNYSNEGMGLLGQLMARHLQTTYEELADQLIAKPLNMPDTFISIRSSHRDRVIQGHNVKGMQVEPLIMNDFQGAGAIRSTASDLLRFLRAHMTAQVGTPYAMTHEPIVKISKKLSSGLGWISDHDMICHNGATSGFSSFMGIDKVSQLGVVVLSNYRNRLIQDTPDRIAYDVMAELKRQTAPGEV